jgi:capsid protein
MASVAPTGYNVKSIAPTHPNNGFDDFNKAVLKQIATSLGVSYSKLLKDYSGVNYSSLREGALDEQAYFQEQQAFIIESWKEIELKLFLESIALHTDIIKPSQVAEVLHSHTWTTVKRPYFDKAKDLLAEERSIALGLKSPTEIIYENGGDPDEVLKGYALWQKLCSKYDLNFKTNIDAELPETAPDDDTNK